ncbi:hypothetical protein WMY93_017253 [Mugilogobius chulae]|uniref:Immunoglobulin V-set domain-containing protein n=1 Tax=Mugilogobius chulae TaxID=88201 RepID=A0AAW0NZB1_9GOBI
MCDVEIKPSYCFGFKNKKFEMGTNITDVFLTISEVNVSDSGLYFCGFFMKTNIVLGETTRLSVVDASDPTQSAVTENSPKDNRFREIFFLTSIALGSLSLILCVAVILLSLRNNRLQKVNKELQTRANEVASEELNYAAVKMKSTTRSQTSDRQTEPHVIYSSTR